MACMLIVFGTRSHDCSVMRKVMHDKEEVLVEEEEVELSSCVYLHTVVGMQKETDGTLKWRCALPHYNPPFITCCGSAP